MELRSRKNGKIIFLLILITAVIAIGYTLAYFTDDDEEINTFSMGNIKIDLDEPNWDDSSGKDLTPGTSLVKDPTVIGLENKSYMRIRMELLDGSDKPIRDKDRINLILKTLYYDPNYVYTGQPEKNNMDITPNIKQNKKYTTMELEDLLSQGRDVIQKEYNSDDYKYAGYQKNNPAVRYYNYVGGDGIFSSSNSATLFTNVVIPHDWNSKQIAILSGDKYVEKNGQIEILEKGDGYKIRLVAEAIQSANIKDAEQAFTHLDSAMGSVIRDTSDISEGEFQLNAKKLP